MQRHRRIAFAALQLAISAIADAPLLKCEGSVVSPGDSKLGFLRACGQRAASDQLFDLCRRSISGSSVAPLRVVEHLDLGEDINFGGIARRIDLATDAFALEQLKEALGHGVVVAIAASAHAGHDIVIAQKVLPTMPSELPWSECTVTGWSTTPQGHPQRIEHQAGIDAATH